MELRQGSLEVSHQKRAFGEIFNGRGNPGLDQEADWP